MSELSELLERFRRGPELVASHLTGAAGPELDFVSGPGRWTVRQILAHLADSEIVGSDRFRRVIAEENPTLMWFDQDAWAANLNYARRKTSESLETFRRLRAENHELLQRAPRSAVRPHGHAQPARPHDAARPAGGHAAHAEGHARQIREVRDKYREARRQASGQS